MPDNYLSNAIDIAGLGYEGLCGASALFLAISNALDNPTHVRELAKAGRYMADDHANLIDCEREHLPKGDVNHG